MKKWSLSLCALGLGLLSTSASAQIFKLTYTPNNMRPPLETQTIQAELKKIEDDINSGLPKTDNPERLMKGMANSSVMSGKGVGSDYASHMQVALLGVGVGVGADLEKDKQTDSDLSGVGLQGGVLIGTNLGWLTSSSILGMEPGKLNVYTNFFAYNYEMNQDKTNAKAELGSWGVHVAYDIIQRQGSRLFGWNGVKIHTGYEYTKMKLKVNSDLNETLSATVGPNTYSSSLTGKPAAEIDVATHSIPVEVSSSFNFLYLFTMYGGLGADLNFGEARGKGNINTNQANVDCTGGCAGNVGKVNATANMSGKGQVNPFLFRTFAGLQFNLPYTRIFVQTDKALGNELVGATAGVRFVY